MLRSIAHASFYFTIPPFLLLKPIPRITCGSSLPCSLTKRRSFRRAIFSGSMSDVLNIFGPLDSFLSPGAIMYVNLLRKFIRSKNFQMAGVALVHLVKLGFISDLFVSNIILDLYAKAGFLDDSVKLFDEMPHKDLISWCTLISCHVNHGFDMEAYRLFRTLLRSGLKPNHFVMSSVLKACSAAGILELGLLVHGLVTKRGFGFDSFVEVGLVGMYAKCGSLNDALKVFYEIPVKSTISWNAVISSCVHNEYLIEAAQMCLEMCRIGLLMDLVTLRIVMRVASALEILDFCKFVHVYSLKVGLETDCFVVAELVKFLTKLGEVAYMSQLCMEVKRPDVSLYALLISGFLLHGCRAEAIKLAEKLLVSSVKPQGGVWINILNICVFKEEGNQIHSLILKTGYLSYTYVGNAMISMYIRCGEMIEAYGIFLSMVEHDAVTWTTIMSGLTHNLYFRKALETFMDFRKTQIQLDEHCISTVVNACTGLQAIDEGRQIHTLALKQGLDFSNFTRASIIHMYAKCLHIGSAARLFSYVSSNCDLILTNVMLAGYCWNSLPLKAFELFKKEYQSGLIPDQFSLSTMLGACADMRSMIAGKLIHCHAVKAGFDFSDTVIQNAIVNMYVKSGNSRCKFYCSTR
ncbi:putative pentatricopeptide repeat-containing protein [Platanthera guangdongensis]|uniref:Pentatricopeptide repeat-containing protein n=1 Tax=Platanthera guangdongensis TaxID=2320717 RepID=A0ABR2LMU9_9ASPA